MHTFIRNFIYAKNTTVVMALKRRGAFKELFKLSVFKRMRELKILKATLRNGMSNSTCSTCFVLEAPMRVILTAFRINYYMQYNKGPRLFIISNTSKAPYKGVSGQLTSQSNYYSLTMTL